MNLQNFSGEQMDHKLDDFFGKEVLALQDWREKATGRLKTLEKRAAWTFLGVAGEGVASQAGVFFSG